MWHVEITAPTGSSRPACKTDYICTSRLHCICMVPIFDIYTMALSTASLMPRLFFYFSNLGTRLIYCIGSINYGSLGNTFHSSLLYFQCLYLVFNCLWQGFSLLSLLLLFKRLQLWVVAFVTPDFFLIWTNMTLKQLPIKHGSWECHVISSHNLWPLRGSV